MSEIIPSKPVELAPNMAYMDANEDIFASQEEEQELIRSGAVDAEIQAAIKARSGGGNYDRSFMFHRNVKFGKEDRLTWTKRLSKELTEAGYSEEEIDKTREDHHFVAVRGIPIEFRYGFRLATDNGKKTLCKTSKMIEHRGGDQPDRAVESESPLKMPIKSPVWSVEKAPNRANWVLEQNPNLDLYANRLVVSKVINESGEEEEVESWEEVRCLDCISRGEYNTGKEICRANGYLLFCVFEVGVRDVTEYKMDKINNPIKVKWVPVQEAGLCTYDGKPLDHPFIIRLEGLGSSQLNKIGMNEAKKDIPVVLPSHMKPKQPKTCYLPDDNVMSAQSFYDWISNPRATDGRSATSKVGTRLITTMTEIYITALHKNTANKDFVPVFRPVATGKNTIFNGESIGTYVQEAIKVYHNEIKIGEGDASTAVSQTVSIKEASEAPKETAQVVEAVATVVTESIEDATGAESSLEPNKNISSAAISAFTVPKAK